MTYINPTPPAISVTQAQIAAGVVISATPKMLCTIIVTTVTAVAAVTIVDNNVASAGTVLAVIPIGAAAGFVQTINAPTALGIAIPAAAGFTGGITVVVGG